MTENDQNAVNSAVLAPRTTFNSMTQACEALGISRAQMKAIKTLCPDGFNKNNSVNADIVRAYFEANRQEIDELVNTSDKELKKIKLANDITLQELEIEEARKHLIPVDEVKKFLQKLGIQVGSLLQSRLVKELPNKIDRVEASERETLLKDVYNEIVNTLQEEIGEWAKNVR